MQEKAGRHLPLMKYDGVSLNDARPKRAPMSNKLLLHRIAYLQAHQDVTLQGSLEELIESVPKRISIGDWSYRR